MGRYDDMTPEEIVTKLRSVARLILRLEERGTLLEETPALLKLLGELRRMLFAYEVRGTQYLDREDDETVQLSGDGAPGDGGLGDSARIVREALEREKELQDELRDRLFPDDTE